MDFDHKNGSSKHSSGSAKDLSEESGDGKHSRKHLEIDETDSSKRLGEGSGSSGHLRRHLDHDYETRRSKHSSKCSGSSRRSDAYPEEIYGGEGHESSHFEIVPEIIEGWGGNNNFELPSEVLDGSICSSKRSDVVQEESEGLEGNIVFSAGKLRLSSSSSGSSRDDQFQADTKLSKSGSAECQKDGSTDPALASQVSCVTHESTSTQSPPIQVMDRLGEYDPYRIPSSVFARSKSITPTDWSVASNDSLFSIQVGSNSFSRDVHFKSGELFKSSEFIAFSPSPVALAADTDKKSSDVVVSDAALKDKTALDAEEPIRERSTHPTVSWNPSVSKESDDNVNSERSFSFPIKKMKKRRKKKKQKEGARPSCYCSNCSWAFCYCRPSCSCSNCSWAFCYCWNCSLIRWSCCHFSNLTDGKSGSLKEKAEQQQKQQQEQPLASASSSKSTWRSWCCCFPSCRWRWHWRQCSCCCFSFKCRCC